MYKNEKEIQEHTPSNLIAKRVIWYYTVQEGSASAIVASVNYFQGEPRDWACYWGATSYLHDEDETVDRVMHYGNKTTEEYARLLFPELKDVPWRK